MENSILIDEKRHKVILVDHTSQQVFDLTEIAEVFEHIAGEGSLLKNLQSINSNLAYNLLQIASANRDETLGEFWMEVAYDVNAIRKFDHVKEMKGGYRRYSPVMATAE